MILLESDQFTKVKSPSKLFGDGETVYAKEIGDHIFLLFIIIKNVEAESMRAFIACFDSFTSIGSKEPSQIMFHLSIKENEDLHYLEKYFKDFQPLTPLQK
ncbi:hypothetical protein [Chryseobacterium sp. ISL-6]|uniref:hypothetical protein n=1 Tax=Chryseobacterium sp. ISL-6 TaxID=2819143 RepID=UPI001BEB8C87|nr:hypothetical protein [Chryseobacterium sp. ISL-6]MBT2620110.1 hypothetical protein [Chryseobacterium sp. ISL-6]